MNFIEVLSKFNWELIIAALAVVISGYSVLASRASNKKIAEQQVQINELLLAKEKKSIDEERKANFRVFNTGSKNDYNLIVTNQGKSDADNVRIEILIEDKYKSYFWNLDEIFPINISSGSSAKTRYTKTMDFPQKFKVKVIWDDEYTTNNSKTISIS